MRLAHVDAERLAGTDQAFRYQGVCASIGWVTSLQESPITARVQGEPTKQEALAEMMAADAVNTGRPIPDAMWDALGVPARPPVTTHRGWSLGVAETLGWLIGSRPLPPIDLPRRRPDGHTMGEDELYEEYLAGTARGPEERRDCRARARRDAGRYRRLGGLAASV
jgi:hypothetical protein